MKENLGKNKTGKNIKVLCNPTTRDNSVNILVLSPTILVSI